MTFLSEKTATAHKLLEAIRADAESPVVTLYRKDRAGGYAPVLGDTCLEDATPPYVTPGSDLAAYLRLHSTSPFVLDRSTFKDAVVRTGLDQFGLETLVSLPVPSNPNGVFILTIGLEAGRDTAQSPLTDSLIAQLGLILTEMRNNARRSAPQLPVADSASEQSSSRTILQASTNENPAALAQTLLTAIEGATCVLIEDVNGIALSQAPADPAALPLFERLAAFELLFYLEMLEQSDEPLFIPEAGTDESEACAIIPITDGRRQLGSIIIDCSEESHAFFTEELVWAMRFAGAYALRRRAASQGHQLRRILTSVENDRARVARELHDETSQNLVALNVRLATAALLLDHDDVAQARGIVEDCAAIADGILDGVNRLSAELRPSELTYLGLADAIQAAAGKRLAKTDIEFELTDNTQDTHLDTLQETMLLNGITEAIANCAKHSGATKLQISMDADDSRLTIAVRDDGHGFDVSPMLARGRGEGVGVRYMRACAEAVNAEFWIGSTEGTGTTVRFSIPNASMEGGQRG